MQTTTMISMTMYRFCIFVFIMEILNLHIFTIGYANHNADSFIHLLKSNNINFLVDVRSIPYSKHNTIFSQNMLKNLLQSNNIKYKWMGDSLGGRRTDLTSETGLINDNEYDNDPIYKNGIAELLQLGLQKVICLMCSEEDPRECHRHMIIANTLIKRKFEHCAKINDIDVTHIRADGRKEDAKKIPVHIQLKLFK